MKNYKKSNWKRCWAFISILELIIIIFLLIQNKKLKEDNLNLKYELSELQEKYSEMKLQKEYFEVLYNQKSKDYTKSIAKLQDSRRITPFNKYRTEVFELKNKIKKLDSKLDSALENHLVENDLIPQFEFDSVEKNTFDSLLTMDSKEESYELDIQIQKNSYLNKEIKRSELLNYSSEISLKKEEGFEKDSLFYLYRYLSEKGDSVEISFTNYIVGERIFFKVLQESKENSKVLFLEDKDFLRAGGLSEGLDKNLQFSWKHLYLEKQIDEPLHRRGNLKFFGGLGGLFLSGGSLLYWANQPDAKIFHSGNITKKTGIIRQRQNTTGEISSIAAGLVSIYFMIDGYQDKKVSLKINQNEIGLKYHFGKK